MTDVEERLALADEIARDAATYAAGTPTRKLLHRAADALRHSAPQADPPRITMADVRKHVGGGMVSSDDVIEAANVLLRERCPAPQADRISFPRWWIEHIRDGLVGMGKLPSGPLGDWAFLFREQLTDALERPTAPPSQAADRMRKASEHAVNMLVRCQTVLANMALENTTGLSAIYNRWPISHEPLRADAKKLVPLIKGALDWYHRAALSRADDNTPEQDSASAGLQSQSGINRSLSEGTPREGANPSDPTPPDRGAWHKMTKLFNYIYDNSQGYLVYRCGGPDRTVEFARGNKEAVFVTEMAASDYCRYRNDLVEIHGDDRLPARSPASGDYVVVPRIPTEAMIEAGANKARDNDHKMQNAPGYNGECRDIWTAMLNAASSNGGNNADK